MLQLTVWSWTHMHLKRIEHDDIWPKNACTTIASFNQNSLACITWANDIRWPNRKHNAHDKTVDIRQTITDRPRLDHKKKCNRETFYFVPPAMRDEHLRVFVCANHSLAHLSNRFTSAQCIQQLVRETRKALSIFTHSIVAVAAATEVIHDFDQIHT